MSRRSLTQVGGQVEVWADEHDLGSLLVAALRVDSNPSAAMQHVHGFHTYPARMHPDTASRLVHGLSRPNDTVLDPFAGSGTVLVEARLHGCRAIGIDANPLAVALSQLKLHGIEAQQRELFLGAVDAITEHAEVRRCSKAGPSRRYPPHYRAAFDSHVLLELDGLSQGIEQACPPELRPVFMLVLSSFINKVSRRRSDTDDSDVQRRLASGFAIRFFGSKARELLARLNDYARRLPPECPPANVRLGDARELPLPRSTVSTIITSPPYPGVYDYVEHHRLRLEWLKLDIKHLERHEIGAHRDFSRRNDSNAEEKWALQLGACLDEMARVLVPSGTAAMLIADTALAGRAWYADRAVQQLAVHHGFVVIGGASQHRGHFHAPTRDAFRAAPRREHLIILRWPARRARSVPLASQTDRNECDDRSRGSVLAAREHLGKHREPSRNRDASLPAGRHRRSQ
jgi:DNA modification methylase